MADDKAVAWSLGFLEGWINEAKEGRTTNSDAALMHLSIVDADYREYRLSNQMLKKVKYII